MKKRLVLTAMLGAALALGLALVGCDGLSDAARELGKTPAEKNWEALKAAGKIYFTVDKPDNSGTVPVVIEFGSRVSLTVDGREAGPYFYDVTETTIILEGAGKTGGRVTLGYEITVKGSVLISSGLSTIQAIADAGITTDGIESGGGVVQYPEPSLPAVGKSITVTGLSAYIGFDYQLYVSEYDAADLYGTDGNEVVALDYDTVKGATITAILADRNGEAWTGSGAYYVILWFYDDLSDEAIYETKVKQPIKDAVTTISLGDLRLVDPDSFPQPDQPDPDGGGPTEPALPR
jgi:hypothetical protein